MKLINSPSLIDILDSTSKLSALKFRKLSQDALHIILEEQIPLRWVALIKSCPKLSKAAKALLISILSNLMLLVSLKLFVLFL